MQVLVWGRGDLGQLGNGAASCAPSPEAMESLAGKDVVHVAAGMYNTAFLTADGELFTSGAFTPPFGSALSTYAGLSLGAWGAGWAGCT